MAQRTRHRSPEALPQPQAGDISVHRTDEDTGDRQMLGLVNPELDGGGRPGKAAEEPRRFGERHSPA